MEAAIAVLLVCLCLSTQKLVDACGHDTIIDLVQYHADKHRQHQSLLETLAKLQAQSGINDAREAVEDDSPASELPGVAATLEHDEEAGEKHQHGPNPLQHQSQQEWLPHLLSHWQTDVASSSLNHMSRARYLQSGTTPMPPAAAPVPGPVRIHVEYQQSQLASQAVNTLQAITNAMAQVLGSYLMVRAPRDGPLLVPPRCQLVDSSTNSCIEYFPSLGTAGQQAGYGKCGSSNINPAHILDPLSCSSTSSSANCTSLDGTHSGELADLYLYVTTTADTQCNSGAAAWALPCLFDPVTNRPLLANANVCPDALLITDPDVLVAVMVHEVTHALGFTSSLYPSYIDPNTNQKLTLSSVVKTSTVGAQTVTRVITPTVVREVRAQFNCPDLEGAQLEDEGGLGSANSHWEYSHYQGELMLASTMFSAAGEPPRLSRMTLALMEDSGWYLGNWSLVGGPLQWGYNTGCVLPSQGCHQFIATQQDEASRMFCDADADAALGSKLRFCSSASYRSTGQCSNVQFANNCSMVVARGAEPSCTDATYQYVNPEVFGWYHGESSRAYDVQYKFIAALTDGSNGLLTYPANGNDGDRDAACYPSSCSASGQLFMSIGGRDIHCPAGQYVDLAMQLPGTFQQGLVGPCPNEADVCGTLGCAACHPKGGICSMGSCECRVGWAGSDCSFSILRNATMPVVVTTPADNANQGPMTANVTQWYQLIGVTMGVTNMTLVHFEDRWNDFIQVVAKWGGVTTQQVTLNVTTLSPQMPPPPIGGGPAALPGGGTPATQQGSLLAMVSPAPAGEQLSGVSIQPHRRAMGELHREQRRQKNNGITSVLRHTMNHIIRQFRCLLNVDAAITLQVVCGIRSASTDQTMLLLAMLQSTQQRAGLANALQTAGFDVDTTSMHISLQLTYEVITEALNNLAANEAATTAKGNAEDDMHSNNLLGSSTIITCIAVAGALLLLSVTVVVVAATRKARIKARQTAAKEQKVAQAMHEQAAIAAAAAAAASAPPMPAFRATKAEEKISQAEASGWSSNQVFGADSSVIAAVPAPGQVFISVNRNPIYSSPPPQMAPHQASHSPFGR